MTSFYMRHPELVVARRGGRAYFVLPDRAPVVLDLADPDATSAVLQDLQLPRPAAEIAARLDTMTLATLLAKAFIVGADDEAKLLAMRGGARGPKRCKHVVLGVTGAIGAVHTFPLAFYLMRAFADRVDVVLTEAACKIVRPEAYRYLGVEVWTDAFAPRAEVNVPHIFLSRADLVLVAPASANTIQKIATGACSDLLSLVVSATRAPVVVAPSMNSAMWENPAIAANVATLRARGLCVVDPIVGHEVSRSRDDAPPEYGAASLDVRAWAPLLDALVAPTQG